MLYTDINRSRVLLLVTGGGPVVGTYNTANEPRGLLNQNLDTGRHCVDSTALGGSEFL